MGLAHTDVLIDEDARCVIDTKTRKITNNSGKNSLIQYDHNSERVGFVMDRYIDGHDMYRTDRVMIHYMNRTTSATYLVDDVSISEDGEHINFSWLISVAATRFAGPLVFAVNFRCVSSENVVEYNWSTIPCSIFTVAEGFDFSDSVGQAQYTDMIAAFESQINAIVANFESYEYVSAIENLQAEISESGFRPNVVEPVIKVGTIMSGTGKWDFGENTVQYSCLTYLPIDVRVTVATGYEIKLLCYDASKNVLGSVVWNISSFDKAAILAVNANTKFVRFSFRPESEGSFDDVTTADLKIYQDALDVVIDKTSDQFKMVNDLCKELNLIEHQEYFGQYFISGRDSGKLISSRFWYAYLVKVSPNTEYEITANTGAEIQSSDTPKMLCATYSKMPNTTDNMASYFVDGTTVYTEANRNEGHTVTVTTSPNAAYMIIACDDVVHTVKTVTDENKYSKRFKDVNGIVNLDSIKEFGSFSNGVLTVTESFSIGIAKPLINVGSPIIFYAYAYFTGSSPTIEYRFRNLYKSIQYTIGSSKGYETTEQRVPPFMSDLNLEVNIVIPEGTTLYLKDFGNYFDRYTNKQTNVGARFDAHLGFYGLCPNNTMIAFEMAEKCGYPSCIVVPKVTSDGVLVCIHDDTINATARDASGNAPATTINVSSKTYNELLTWDFGIYKHAIYKGVRIPLLSDFFDLCAKTGMKPMFSTHPDLTIAQWREVKSMLLKRGLLSSFTVKAFDIAILRNAFSVLGNDIEGYIYDVNSNEYSTYISQLHTLGTTRPKGIEYPLSAITSNVCEATLNAGYFVSAWSLGRPTSDRYKELIAMGVSRFTDDYNCSYGLNW